MIFAILVIFLVYSIGFTAGMNYGQAVWSPLVYDCVDYLKDCAELIQCPSNIEWDDIFIGGEKVIQIRMYAEKTGEHEICPNWYNETLFCTNVTLDLGYNYIEVINHDNKWSMYVNNNFVFSKEVQYEDTN